MPPRSEPQPGLALALRRLRESKGLSQEEVARRAGLHLTWIGRLESGKANPTWGNARKVAVALDVTLAQLAALAEDADSES